MDEKSTLTIFELANPRGVPDPDPNDTKSAAIATGTSEQKDTDETAPTVEASLLGEDIPDFLRRNADGSFTHPDAITATVSDGAIYAKVNEAMAVARGEPPTAEWLNKLLDAELSTMCYSDSLTLVERQPFYQEARRREDKKKAYARIAALKEAKEPEK